MNKKDYVLGFVKQNFKMHSKMSLAFDSNLYYVKNVQIWNFLWSVFSCIRSKCGDLLRKSPYSVRIQENTDQKKLRIWTPFTQCYFSYSWKFPCLYFYINIAIENLSKIKSRVNYIYTAPY